MLDTPPSSPPLHASAPRRTTGRGGMLAIVLSVGVFTLLLVGAVIALTGAGKRIISEHGPQNRIMLDFRYQMIDFHLLLEEHLAGDRDVAQADVWDPFLRARHNMRVLIEGGERDGVSLAPLADAELLDWAEDMDDDLVEVEAIARRRLLEAGSPNGEDLDDILTSLIDHVLIEGGDFENALAVMVARETEQFEQFERFLLIGLVLAGGGILIVLLVYEARRLRYVQELETERVTLEQNVRNRTADLKERSDFIRAVLGNMVDGVVTIDEKGTVFFFNDAAAHIFGYSAEEVVGRNVKMLMPEPFKAEHDFYLSSYMKTGEKKVIGIGRQVVGRRKDGSTFPLDLAVNEVATEGSRHFVGNIRDITELVSATNELVQAKEGAEKANMAKSEFLSSMSHELRTPLNAIIGFAQLLDMDPLDEEQKDSVGQILRSGEHLLGLINDVLDLARIESGNLSMSIEDVNPAPSLQQCFNMATSMSSKYSVTVKAMANADDLPAVRADQTRLKQVLLNFLSNAVKYNNRGGEVALTCERVDGGFLRFSVADTGPGIPADKQKYLFQPFSRLDREGSEIEGTGIGLVITKELVTLMGGRTGFRSVEGEGSTFWFDLPISGEGAVVESAQAAHVFSGKRSYDVGLGENKRVLYIEDNPANLMLVEKIIQRVPMLDLISATTAEVGLEMAEAEHPDAILMDINLPGMDGVDAMKVIAQREKLRNIPVIAVSAAAMEADINRGMAAGFRAYLTKPIRVEALLDALKAAFGTGAAQ